MNLRVLFLGSLLAVAGSALLAEPLTRDASVYARPDPSATVLGMLPTGTEPALILSDPTAVLLDGRVVSTRPDLVLPVPDGTVV